MILSEEPRKGTGPGKGTGSDENSGKEKSGKGKTSRSRKMEDDDDLDAGMDSFGDDEDLDDEIDDEMDEWEKADEEDIMDEDEEPVPPARPTAKGGKAGRQKSVMEDFDVGDTDYFERDYFDDDDDDDFDIGKNSKSSPGKSTGQRRLRPLNKNNNPAGGTDRPKGDDDPTFDDPNENPRLK